MIFIDYNTCVTVRKVSYLLHFLNSNIIFIILSISRNIIFIDDNMHVTVRKVSYFLHFSDSNILFIDDNMQLSPMSVIKQL